MLLAMIVGFLMMIVVMTRGSGGKQFNSEKYGNARKDSQSISITVMVIIDVSFMIPVSVN